jgi:hypothetical protein
MFDGRHATTNGNSPRELLYGIYVGFEVDRYRIIFDKEILGDSTPSCTLPISEGVI